MDPATNTSGHLVTAVTLELLDEEIGSRLLDATLDYDREDPFAVRLSIMDGEQPVVWTMSRELLADGLHEPTGDGDVHAWPSLDGRGRAILLLELSTREESALLLADPREVVAFLAATHEVVAPGTESAHLDVTAVVEAIFAAAAS